MRETNNYPVHIDDLMGGLILRSRIIEQVHEGTAGLFGLSQEQMTGQPFFQYIAPDSCKTVESFIEGELSGNRISSCDVVIQRNREETRIVRMTATSRSFPKDQRLVLIITDISDLVQEQESLRKTISDQDILIDTTRHDLMNKLSLAYSYNSLLLASVGDPQAITYLDHQSAALHGIERHLCCMQRYRNSGKSKASWQPLYDTLRSAMSPFELCLFCINPDKLGYEVFAECLFENVFSNLFENAIRYARGLTRITLSARETEEGLIISVSDNGEGIPDPEKERIFEKGVGQGTGLGLALSREILAGTGIRIRECGKFGQGAWFEILVPHGKYRGPGKISPDLETLAAVPSIE
ncbi:MAG: ATP-binding protein [Methanoregulaceae archaeon]